MRDVESAADEPESGRSDDSLTIVAQADAPPSAGTDNVPPEAEDMCILTAEDATLSFSVVAKDPDGDPLTVTVSQPQSGSAEAGPDGMVTFVADQPGVQQLPVFGPGWPGRRGQRGCDRVRQSAHRAFDSAGHRRGSHPRTCRRSRGRARPASRSIPSS